MATLAGTYSSSISTGLKYTDMRLESAAIMRFFTSFEPGSNVQVWFLNRFPV